MSTDRVTNKQLYDELKTLRNEVPSKTEMRLTIALATVGANAVAALLLKLTSTGGVAQTAVEHVLRLF